MTTCCSLLQSPPALTAALSVLQASASHPRSLCTCLFLCLEGSPRPLAAPFFPPSLGLNATPQGGLFWPAQRKSPPCFLFLFLSQNLLQTVATLLCILCFLALCQCPSLDVPHMVPQGPWLSDSPFYPWHLAEGLAPQRSPQIMWKKWSSLKKKKKPWRSILSLIFGGESEPGAEDEKWGDIAFFYYIQTFL